MLASNYDLRKKERELLRDLNNATERAKRLEAQNRPEAIIPKPTPEPEKKKPQSLLDFTFKAPTIPVDNQIPNKKKEEDP